MKRAAIAAVILLLGLGGLCTAWYASAQRALEAELHEREHRAQQGSVDRERATAESLARRLEDLRREESQRPYFHYQNLYHDPKGISEGLSVVPSPLASGPGNPLVTSYFQIERNGRVTLPTLNEDLRELNAPDAAEQVSIRDTLARSSPEMRAAAAPLVEALQQDDARTRATANRIADLEARLADATRRTAYRQTSTPARDPWTVLKAGPPLKVDKIAKGAAETGQQSQFIDRSAFDQNARANVVYRDLKQRAQNVNEATAVPQTDTQSAPAPAPTSASAQQQLQQQQVAANVAPVPAPAPEQPSPAPRPSTRRESPVEIRTTDLVWHTISVDHKPRLLALRGVLTPEGSLVQGLLTPLAEGAAFDGATVRRASGTSIEGTGWRLQLAPAASLATIRRDHAAEVQRFQRTFIAVATLLLLVVAGTVWMVSRAEALALEKSRFAATAAHELRTPLASLRLYSEMIADERDPERRERYAREISGQTERLGRLVANVLEVTRIERGTFALQPREGAIGPAVQACVEKLRPQMEAAGCPVELRVESDLPAVAFDADALHHIVDNLLDNAEKYSRDAPERNISVAVAPENGGVTITVSDHGPGVPDTLFREPRPFRRATSSTTAGLGLGHFLVDRIVRGHGGAIRSTSRPGGGASVHVFLPAFYKA